MRKFFLSSVLGLGLLFLDSCVWKEETAGIAPLKDRINTLEEQVVAINGSILSLEETDRLFQSCLDTVIDEMTALIAVKDELLSLTLEDSTALSTIEDSLVLLEDRMRILTEEDSLLQGKISDLKNYSESLIEDLNGNLWSWAEGTLATLAQNDSLCTVVAELQVRLDSLEDSHQDLLAESVAQLESSLTDWVNGRFSDYYTISEVDVRIARIQDIDTSVRTEMDSLKVALDSVKAQITRGYQSAIETAVTTLEGEISDKIDSDLSALKATLQGKIDEINVRITDVESHLSSFEGKLSDVLSRVHSVSVVPDLSDGSVKVMSEEAVFTVDLAVFPLSAADSIAKHKLEMPVTFEIYYGESAAASTFGTLKIKDINYADELLTLAVENNLPQDVKDGKVRAFARVIFYSEEMSVATSTFPLSYIKDVTYNSVMCPE